MKLYLSKNVLSKKYKTVFEFLSENPGPFPGKFIIRKTATGIAAFLDDESAGNVMEKCADGTLKAYSGDDLSFDAKGQCVSLYTLSATSTDGTAIVVELTVVAEATKVKTTEKADASAYAEEIQRIADNGILTVDQAKRNVEVMVENRVPEKLIRTILNKYHTWDRPTHVAKTSYVPVDNSDNRMTESLIQVLEGSSVIFEGGQSVGKNVLAESIAMVLNRPYYLVTFSSDMCSDDIYGGKSTDNSAAEKLTMDLAYSAEYYDRIKTMGGDYSSELREDAVKYKLYSDLASSVKLKVDYAEIPECIAGGGICCLNEMNNADPNLFGSFMNQILDGTGFITIPGRGRIKIHPECAFIGTQNPNFVGTLQQNQATLSRFGFIYFGYPKSIIGPLKAALKGVDVEEKKLAMVNNFYMELLRAAQDGVISDATLNIRGFVRALRNNAEWDAPLKRQIEIQVVGSVRDEAEKITVNEKLKLYFK